MSNAHQRPKHRKARAQKKKNEVMSVPGFARVYPTKCPTCGNPGWLNLTTQTVKHKEPYKETTYCKLKTVA